MAATRTQMVLTQIMVLLVLFSCETENPRSVCGDGDIDTNEECDDGNSINTDACVGGCKKAICGDGVFYEGVEECDGGASCDKECRLIVKKPASTQVVVKPPEAPVKIENSAYYNVPVGASFVKGSAAAKVTIIIFSDFQCPFCKKVESVLAEVQATYGADVRLVWKDFPLKSIHPNALSAAVAARAAGKQGSDKFFAMRDVLFQNQPTFSGKGNLWTAEQFIELAKLVPGLDTVQWMKDVADLSLATAVEEDIKAATTLGVTGTPAFFINGELLKGAGDIKKFAPVIDRQRLRAEEFLAKGIPAEKLYEEMTKDGLTKGAGKPGAADPTLVYKIPIPADAPYYGPKDAKVTIVAFSDFQCPFCAKVSAPPTGQFSVLPALTQIKSTYGKDVKIVYRHNPLQSIHPNAYQAAEAAMAAHEQGKFWEMHDKLFQNQRALSRADLEAYASDLKLDLTKFKDALDTGKFKAQIDADIADAKLFGAPSTPSFFVNGRFIKGAAGFEKFQTIIDEEIKKADDLIAKGTPLSGVYAALTALGLEKVGALPPKLP